MSSSNSFLSGNVKFYYVGDLVAPSLFSLFGTLNVKLSMWSNKLRQHNASLGWLGLQRSSLRANLIGEGHVGAGKRIKAVITNKCHTDVISRMCASELID